VLGQAAPSAHTTATEGAVSPARVHELVGRGLSARRPDDLDHLVSGGNANLSDRRETDAGPGPQDRGVPEFPVTCQEIPVLIAILDLRTTPADRPAALAQLDSERDEIRAMPGNLDFRVYAARDDEGAVTVVHEWADEPSFARYLESEAFTRSGAVLRPMVTAPPVSRRFRAALLETV
jgi:quinol monooxygenase YgiN